MTKQEIVTSLHDRFKKHGISKADITTFIESALSNGLTLEQTELGTRMALCSHLGIEQYYTVDDVMVATGESRQAVEKKMQEISTEMISRGENPLEYFPRVTFSPYMQ